MAVRKPLWSLGLSFSLAANLAIAAPAPALNANWQEAVFTTQFNPNQEPMGSVTLYRSPADKQGQTWNNSFSLLTPELFNTLARATNPWSAFYPNLYTPANRQKRAACPLISTPVEIDDNPQTHEWVIAFSSERCLYYSATDNLRYGDDEAHKWVLQQMPNGQARILAEGDGLLAVIQQGSGFKDIKTQALVPRLFPQDPLQCGSAELTWHYQQNRYQLANVDYRAHDCEPLYFPHLRGAAWEQDYAEYVAKVQGLIDSWLYK